MVDVPPRIKETKKRERERNEDVRTDGTAAYCYRGYKHSAVTEADHTRLHRNSQKFIAGLRHRYLPACGIQLCIYWVWAVGYHGTFRFKIRLPF